VIAIDLNRVEFAGAWHDPVAALVLCGPVGVDESWVFGSRLVDGGRVVGLDQEALVAEHNMLSGALVD
jgi:hypothetical protein